VEQSVPSCNSLQHRDKDDGDLHGRPQSIPSRGTQGPLHQSSLLNGSNIPVASVDSRVAASCGLI
jgi:hypothetical protein